MSRFAMLFSVIAVGSVLVGGGAFGQASSSANKAMMDKSKACKAEAKAKGLKGPDQNAYTKTCVKK